MIGICIESAYNWLLTLKWTFYFLKYYHISIVGLCIIIPKIENKIIRVVKPKKQDVCYKFLKSEPYLVFKYLSIGESFM